ncbi:Bug family tripartite tricarboxylate transporter substrate binding protein [Polynucleobacter kasalickyi]|uniref:Tripartite-type tricarboxylate transporter, receptor component TctC n=1 Tax=Polynucleobacter kasalickyi TaxID=1938817 RepID=A0A1W1YMH7_9BURK|nr:tripartite tricarboxylate transporter substrate binding protein [Polynucleobacter kasalickyi]SMC37354.1 Tripartite-type tricarboxylate transporter, receptor component TctC [Polynucleobacter kasalickyi]
MRQILQRSSVYAILWVAYTIFSLPSYAQSDPVASYPNRPIHIVVSFPPGGSPDFTARVIGQQLGKILNQSVVVENKSGAGGNVGTQYVASSKPDGYTLLVNSSAFTVNPSLYAGKAGYDPIKDFIAVSIVSKQANVVSVNESVPVNTLAELRLLSGKDKLSFSTPGNGTTPHLTCENLFHSVWKADITHIPYKGAGPASLAVASGETPIGCTAGFGVAQFAKQGKVKILAISSDTRSPNLPDVPTFIELGYPQINDYTLSGFFLPSKTPIAIAEKLNKAINEALASPEVREKFEKAGLVPVGGSLSSTQTAIVSELKHWSQIVKSTGAKVD